MKKMFLAKDTEGEKLVEKVLISKGGIYIDEKAIVYPHIETILKDNMEIKIYSEDELAILDLYAYALYKARSRIL